MSINFAATQTLPVVIIFALEQEGVQVDHHKIVLVCDEEELLARRKNHTVAFLLRRIVPVKAIPNYPMLTVFHSDHYVVLVV